MTGLSATASPEDWWWQAGEVARGGGRWQFLLDRDDLTGSEWCAGWRRLPAGAWRSSGAYVPKDIDATIYPSRLCRVMWRDLGDRSTIAARNANRVDQSPDIVFSVFSALQTVEEPEQLVSRLIAPRSSVWRQCFRKSPLLHCECGFEIDLRGLHRLMSKPQRNHRTIHARL
jgi:hypothetical protein